jgi:hypothetical protein
MICAVASINNDNESFQLDENDIPSSKGGNDNKMLLDLTNISHVAEARMCPITVVDKVPKQTRYQGRQK